MKPHLRLRTAGTAAFLLATLSAIAQVTPPTIFRSKEEVLELSPFEVRTDRDNGWVASSTLAGNRTNTELINVAATVDAIIPEFMRDLGVYRLEDIAQFVANVDVVSLLIAVDRSTALSPYTQ